MVTRTTNENALEGNAPVAIEVWVDVGGTFTDCFVRREDGQLDSIKLLSSGRVPLGAFSEDQTGSTHNGLAIRGDSLTASVLDTDPDEFWTGADLVVQDGSGHELRRVPVVGFGNATLTTDRDLAALVAQHPTVRLELDARVESPVLATHRLLQVPLAGVLPPLHVRLGTTKGTNTLLTRSGATTALAITAPLGDLLRIGNQSRIDLFDLSARKPKPLTDLVIGIEERLAGDGSVLLALNEEQARDELSRAWATGARSLAICLLHGYLNPIHERQLVEIAKTVGFQHVSCSHQLAPLIEIVARAQTCVVDAYLSPVINDYLEVLAAQFSSTPDTSTGPAPSHTSSIDCDLQVMTSAGGLVDWRTFRGKDSILSGPAGGVAALRAISHASGEAALIGLDMGGTSTDVCRVTPEAELQYESLKAGVRILTPTLPIETVASGGGSICWFDGISFRVGPQSAGADPGPACYGRGGPLTITDVNVFLGRVPERQFPFPLDTSAIQTRLDEIISASSSATNLNSAESVARGFRRIANEQMAEAVRTVSIAQGSDPRQHALAGFGGAAGQHICDIAQLLDINCIVDVAQAGLLSALGMGLANQRVDSTYPVYRSLPQANWTEVQARITQGQQQLHRQLCDQGVDAQSIQVHGWFELRYLGTDTTLAISATAAIDDKKAFQAGSIVASDVVAEQFEREHDSRFGYRRTGHEIELVALRLEATGAAAAQLPTCSPPATIRPLSTGPWESIDRARLSPGDQVCGPAIVLNSGSTLVVESDWQATCQSDGSLILRRQQLASTHSVVATSGQLDAVARDCFAARLSAIATQMGHVLQRTAISTNVKQRRDYSCAVFDAQGQLLANAPHVPVHLGAMGETVRGILRQFHDMLPGDSFVTNDPYQGGSHLPDITVVTPVFDSTDSSQVQDAESRPLMFVASRAHHADVGGLAPGSMSIAATRLEMEGVIIPPMHLTRAGQAELERLTQLFSAAPYPPRNPQEILADIAAQQAAGARGAELLCEYATNIGWEAIPRYSGEVLDAAEQRVTRYFEEHRHFGERSQGTREFSDQLDDGTSIRVVLRSSRQGRLDVSFAGSGDTHPQNFNANPSIVRAALMYVIRCLLADDLPLNDGTLRAVQLTVPEGILNPRAARSIGQSPAVAAGNVETSQRVVDVLLGAFGVAAASQGTMNNLLFGIDKFGFYETIGGGAGGSATFAGEHAVHSHMTNTRLTDPEVLEARYPVRLRRFEIRSGSGGQGQFAGGDGMVREFEFLQPMSVSLLTSRRAKPPFGMQGGQPGCPGTNTLIRSGQRQVLEGCCQFTVLPGDRLEIQTPGGGGFGIPPTGSNS